MGFYHFYHHMILQILDTVQHSLSQSKCSSKIFLITEILVYIKLYITYIVERVHSEISLLLYLNAIFDKFAFPRICNRKGGGKSFDNKSKIFCLVPEKAARVLHRKTRTIPIHSIFFYPII